MITGWSIPIKKNKIIMNGDVTYGYEKIILAGALGIAALSGTNVPGLELTKASAASIESNFDVRRTSSRSR